MIRCLKLWISNPLSWIAINFPFNRKVNGEVLTIFFSDVLSTKSYLTCLYLSIASFCISVKSSNHNFLDLKVRFAPQNSMFGFQAEQIASVDNITYRGSGNVEHSAGNDVWNKYFTYFIFIDTTFWSSSNVWMLLIQIKKMQTGNICFCRQLP